MSHRRCRIAVVAVAVAACMLLAVAPVLSTRHPQAADRHNGPGGSSAPVPWHWYTFQLYLSGVDGLQPCQVMDSSTLMGAPFGKFSVCTATGTPSSGGCAGGQSRMVNLNDDMETLRLDVYNDTCDCSGTTGFKIDRFKYGDCIPYLLQGGTIINVTLFQIDIMN